MQIGHVVFAGVLVALFDQQPLLLAVCGGPRSTTGAHQGEGSAQLVAAKRQIKFARPDGAGHVVLGVDRGVNPAVPDDHGSSAIVAFGNHAFEVAVFKRMVLDHHGQMLVGRVERGAFGHGPGPQHSFHFQPQIVMQPGGVVLLDHENAAVLPAAGSRPGAERLGRSFRVALADGSVPAASANLVFQSNNIIRF